VPHFNPDDIFVFFTVLAVMGRLVFPPASDFEDDARG
jgi:hypothetical protein